MPPAANGPRGAWGAGRLVAKPVDLKAVDRRRLTVVAPQVADLAAMVRQVATVAVLASHRAGHGT